MRLAPPEQAGGQSGGDTSCIVKVEEGAAVKVKEEEEGEGGGDDQDRIREMIMKGTPRVLALHPQVQKSKPQTSFDSHFVTDARRAMGQAVEDDEVDARTIAMGEDTFVVGKKKKVVSDR
jgi:hypothetical protein